jgi:hypothetical protein
MAKVYFQYSCSEVEEISQRWKYASIGVSIEVLGFFLMVSSLLLMHTFLAVSNLTTCKPSVPNCLGEFLSWMKISYMKVWPRRYGSPFSLGSRKANLRLFCLKSFSLGTYIYKWSMPSKLPKLI